MKTAFLFLFLFNFKAIAGHCKFKAKVHPEIFKKETEDIYKEVCHWFHANFQLYPLLELGNVFYVKNWNFSNQRADLKKFIDRTKHRKLKGVFFRDSKDKMNKIYILSPNYGRLSLHTRSVVAHEIIHFLVKAASFKKIQETKAFENHSMMETFAYWGQNKFIERHSDKTLWDFTEKESDTYLISKTFPLVADIFYNMLYDLFIYNSIVFFDRNRIEKYNKLITNKFPRDPMFPDLDF